MSFKYKDQEIVGSDNDIYSTDEVRIGTWIDGKPLYRIAGVSTTSSATGETKVLHSPINNLSAVINICGTYVHNGYWTQVSTITAKGEPISYPIVYSPSIGVYYVNYAGDNSWLNIPLYWYIEYTKTTD